MRHNTSFQGTLRDKAVQRPLNSDVEAVEKPIFVGIQGEEMARIHRAIFVSWLRGSRRLASQTEPSFRLR